MSQYQIIDSTSEIPHVSVAMLAYNHEKFVAKALDSVLMQETSYNYKLVIAEDKSSDATREILLDYQKRFPDKIKLILQDKNVGPQVNNNGLLTNLEGKYVAALECDDYWTDTLKLQKQIDFLEKNADYNLVSTSFSCLDERTGKIVDVVSVPADCDIDFYSQLVYNKVGTLTCVFRAYILDEFLALYDDKSVDFAIGDYALWFAALKDSKKGRILNDTTATYRILDNSVTSRFDSQKHILFHRNAYKVQLFFANKIKDAKNRNFYTQLVVSQYLSENYYKGNREEYKFAFQQANSMGVVLTTKYKVYKSVLAFPMIKSAVDVLFKFISRIKSKKR